MRGHHRSDGGFSFSVTGIARQSLERDAVRLIDLRFPNQCGSDSTCWLEEVSMNGQTLFDGSS